MIKLFFIIMNGMFLNMITHSIFCIIENCQNTVFHLKLKKFYQTKVTKLKLVYPE